MSKGAAPPHWKVRGGAAKLNPAGHLVLVDRLTLYPNIKTLPKNFTVETEFVPKDASGGHLGWVFENQDSTFQWSALFQSDSDEIYATLNVNDEGWSKLGEGRVKIHYGKLNRLAVWYQDSRIRMYVNDQRAVDLNQVELKPWSRAVLDFTSDSPVELGTVRIAESMPDISQVLASTGKYVSHAIQFDTGSDQLRPESMNVIKEVAAALQKQPALKLRIEGHTDSTGDAAKNLDLSKRRAESVKGALVKLGISPDRLTTEGFGQTKPLAPEDTPQGRAENRRVEFVKV
ncbi:MAG: OmpA family protein [Terriglobia bacterium]|jgi:outer membrane protein OmpA-like peptidoglycan-associated protein